MLRLYSKITFTPPAPSSTISGLPQSVTATELFKKLNQPLTAQRETVIFDFVNEVETDTSHKELTSTAKIVIPRKLTFNGQDIATGTQAIFRRGDKVKIECGYYPDLKTLFEGYISNVRINAPIVIECEDEMFNLAKKHVFFPASVNTKKSGKKTKITAKECHTQGGIMKNGICVIPLKMKLKDFIKNVILQDTNYELLVGGEIDNIDMDIAIIKFDCSARECLNKLKETFKGFYAYFQDGKLNVGFLNDANITNTVEFHFEENIIDDSRLEYIREQDIQLVCRATSYNPDTGTQISVTWPPDIGPETPSAHIDVFTSTRMSETDLLKFAQKNCETRKYDGYRGSFLTFGETFVRPGDAAKLIDVKYPERNGTYIVNSVRRFFGVNGYRQEIELGVRVAFN